VYTGRNCAFTLYEDEGTNYNYEKGGCSTIKFTYDESSGELTIGERTGKFKGMLEKRIFNIVWITRDNQVAFDPDLVPDDSVTWEGKEIVIKKSVK